MISARADRFAPLELSSVAQFGGFGGVIGGGVGITIPAIGSGGGFAGGFGGGGGAPAGSIGPLLTLEAAFGTGFTAQSIADAIRVAEQEGRFEAETGGFQTVIDIATGPTGATIVLNLARGLFEIFDSSGRKLGGGVTPEAAIEAVRGGPGGAARVAQLLEPAEFAAPSAPTPGPTGGGELNELIRTILGALGQLRERPTPRGLEPVAIGGSVNVPVVRGSTADPTGTLRPVFPVAKLPGPAPEPVPTFPAPGAPTARGPVAAAVAQDLLRILLQIRAERALKDAQRRQRELVAQQLAAIRRITMGFGQNGVSLGLQGPRDSRGPLETAGVGGGFFGTVADILIGLGTNISADLLTRLNVTRDPEKREITVPNGANAELEALLRAAGGGDVATQCGLFRGRGGMRMSSRPASVVCLPDPITGEARFFGHLGRPLVFQRDVTMARNIPKLIRKLGGGRRSKR